MGISYGFDGETDRIIAKYARKKRIPMKEFGLRFVDYQNKNNLNDKIHYLMQKNESIIFIRNIKSLIHVAPTV
jgi:hypothetical protein